MMGLHQPPQVRDGHMAPLEAWGIRAMSIGLLVDERQAMIWRGPMVMGALGQLLGDVEWGVSMLVVDMPPGAATPN
jgi:ATP-binding protein involved in chromosome partitioning